MGDLLTLAHDLADRLLTSFGGTATGLPHPRVNLASGVPGDGFTTTCTAGAGSLVLEMGTGTTTTRHHLLERFQCAPSLGVVSRLLGDPTYESYARRAARALWRLRDNSTGLTGNVVDINTGEWISKVKRRAAKLG